MTKALAYYVSVLITVIQCFNVQAVGCLLRLPLRQNKTVFVHSLLHSCSEIGKFIATISTLKGDCYFGNSSKHKSKLLRLSRPIVLFFSNAVKLHILLSFGRDKHNHFFLHAKNVWGRLFSKKECKKCTFRGRLAQPRLFVMSRTIVRDTFS